MKFRFTMIPLGIFIKSTNTHHEWQRENHYFHVNIENGLLFICAIEYVSDETKIMLYYHDGAQKVCRNPLTALENKNLISSVKFGKLYQRSWYYQNFR